MSVLQPNFIDSFGKLNLLDTIGEEWVNIQLEIKDKRQEIIGIDLNTLLFGLFRLFGKKTFRKDDFSCDIRAWENIVEPTFVYISHVVPMNDILMRVLILLRKLSIDTEEIVSGALEFLTLWLGQYRCFLQAQHLLLVNAFATSETSTFLGIQQDYEAYGLDPKLLERFMIRLERLRQVAASALQEQVNDQLHWDAINNLPLFGPQLFLTEGIWDGQLRAEIKEQLKKTLQEGPKIKLEIFGGEALLDSDSDDDEDEEEVQHLGIHGDDGEENIHYPQVRIAPGVALIDSVAVFAQRLLDIDPLELARQWTLLDSALFRRLRLHSLLKTCIGAEEDSFMGNKLLQDTVDFGGVKRLVDRFNSASTWVSSVILAGDSPVHRGLLITKFISLASHLQQLGNFLGLMTVLTALQQGCISRLTLSFEQVSRTALQQLNHFKKLMAAGKNYARYRSELFGLQAQLSFEEAQNRLKKKRQKQGLVYEDFDWKINLHNKFAASGIYVSASPVSPIALLDATGMDASIGTYQFEVGLQAVVPHLPAHVAALTAIAEVHASEYVPDHPHLFHVTKWRQMAGLLLPLAKLQTLKYDIQPVRIVGASLQYEWKRHLARSTAQSTSMSKRLYQLSEARESVEMIHRVQHQQQQQQQQQQIPSPGLSPKGKKSVTMSGVSCSAAHTTAEINNNSNKFQKSAAYDRIRRSSSSMNNSSSNNLTKNNNSNSNGIGPGNLKRQPSRFTRMLSSVFSRRAEEDEDEEDDEDDDEDEEEGDEDEEEEDEEDDYESEENNGKKKGKLRFKTLLKAISFRK